MSRNFDHLSEIIEHLHSSIDTEAREIMKSKGKFSHGRSFSDLRR